ncbi:MAG: amidohydrolase family protein [Spirochaetales bacterium]|nr:amidohydrolase family protein [Spirochaetales bacterium]
MNHDCVITGGLLVYPEKTICADLAVSGGKISAVARPGEAKAKTVIDAEGCYLLPGAIDPHTHPVYLDSIADTARSASFGGVTTVIHYAYARPGNSLVDKIREFKEEAEATSCIDFALHGGLFETLKQADEIPRAFEMGVSSFKVFMAYAKLGWMTDDYAMAKTMDIVGKHGGMVCVHAETGLAIDYIMDRMLAEKANFAERFLETSPDIAEAEGIFRAVYIGRLMSCPVYIPHISSAEGIRVIRFLKGMGYPVIAETCPQYLGLTWEKLKARGPLGKVGPSIKTEEDRLALWTAMQEGLFDSIGSDHAPKDKKPKDDFFEAAYGSPEVETMLPVVWHFGVNRGLITPNEVAALTAENTSRIMGLYPRKGRLEPGCDADVVVFDPKESWTVSTSNQHSNASYTLFEGQELLGRVRKVLSRGQLIVDGEQFLGSEGHGEFLPSRAGNWRYRQ